MISGHGNNLYSYGGTTQIDVDFSSNVAFNSHSREIAEYLKDVMGSIADYPDPMARALSEALAKELSLPDNEILITNGSAEAFYLIAHYLKRHDRSRSVVVTPSFAEYEDSCRVYDHEIEFVNLEELTRLNFTNYDSVWLGLPNNPDGARLDYATVLDWASQNSECVFVVDRAYNELSDGMEQRWELLPNIIIVDSFTKSYGVPGLRLGYIIAAANVIESLAEIRPPWSVNSLSQLAGLYIIAHREALQPDRGELIEQSRYLQRGVASVSGFRVIPSASNFFLVEILGDGTAADLKRYLVEEHRILIRDCSNFRGLSPKYFRLAAQSREACDRLLLALESWR